MWPEIILERGLAELYALFDAFFMRHVEAVMRATDAAARARVCVCVCAFISLLRPCTLCRKTKTSAMKINIRQQQQQQQRQQQVASARSTLLKDMPAAGASLGHQLAALHTLYIPLLVQLYLYLPYCVCVYMCHHYVRIVWPDVSFRIEFSILRSCSCIPSYRIFNQGNRIPNWIQRKFNVLIGRDWW